MTSMSYIVTFDDSDMYTLEQALAHYLSVCEREIAKGGTVPFIAHSGTIGRIRSKLNAALLEGFRDYERWVRTFEKSLPRPKARTRAGRVKRDFPRTSRTDKRSGRKRKSKRRHIDTDAVE
jgi:hypothetical protein